VSQAAKQANGYSLTSPEELTSAQGFVLGLVNGTTELLPISSSLHIGVVSNLFGWHFNRLDPNYRKSFEVATHGGSIVGLLIGFSDEVAKELARPKSSSLQFVLLSSLPAVVIGYCFEEWIEERLATPNCKDASTAIGALLLGCSTLMPQSRSRGETTVKDSLTIGLLQSCALAPGFSRSGTAFAATRLLKFKQRDGYELARLSGVIPTVGAVCLKGLKVVKNKQTRAWSRSLIAGFIGSLVGSLLGARTSPQWYRPDQSVLLALYRVLLAVWNRKR